MPDVILVNTRAPNCCGRERTLSAVVAKFESLTREKDDEEKDEDCQFGEKTQKKQILFKLFHQLISILAKPIKFFHA